MPNYSYGICYGYYYENKDNGEHADFESDGNLSTTGKGSDFYLYYYDAGDITEISIEDIIDEMETEKVDVTNEESVRKYLEKHYIDAG